MNNIFSKIISLILCLSIFVCTMPALAEDTLYDDRLTQAFSVLSQLGVFSENDIEAIDPDQRVSRGEFVLAVINLIGSKNLSHKEGIQGFSDVTASNKYYDSVMAGASLGFIHGSGDGKFKPNDKITADAAVKILVSLLGWEDTALNKGGYPSGYFVKANELDLMNDVSFGYDDRLTMRDVIILLYNAIGADTLVIDSISDDSVSYGVNSNGILAQYRGIYKSKGKLLGNDTALLCSHERLSKGEIIIDDKVYNYTQNTADELLGMSVEYYYDKNDNIIALAEEYEANTVKIITSEDIAGYSNNKYSYYDGYNIRDLKISKDADIGYNGSILTNFSASFLVPESGIIKFIDTNGDNTADSVIIESYDIYVVNGADSQNEIIYDKYTPGKILNLGEYESYYITDEIGNNLRISDLSQNTVVSVSASSDKSVAKLLCSNSEMEGVVTSTSQNNKYISINGREFKVSPGAVGEAAKIKLGGSYLFKFDIIGNVAALIASEENYHWGYLVAARETEGIDKAVAIRLLGDDGIMHYFEVNSGLKLNNEKIEQNNLYNKLLDGESEIKSGIVRYRSSGDRLIEIDRAVDNYYSGYNDDKTPKKVIRWTKAASAFGGKVAVDSSTIYFALPTDDNAEDENFQVITSSFFTIDENKYSINAYRYNPESHVADVIVTYAENVDKSISEYTASRIVADVVQAVDPDGMEGTKIKFADGLEYFVKDNSVLNAVKFNVDDIKAHKLVCGDMIRIGLNDKDAIIKIELVYDRAGKRLKGIGGNTTVNYDTDVWGTRSVLANVYSKDGDNLLITQNSLDGANITVPYENVETLFAGLFKIYKCYVSRGEYVVEEASVSDIYDYKSMGSSYSKIVVTTQSGYPKHIVVYQ